VGRVRQRPRPRLDRFGQLRPPRAPPTRLTQEIGPRVWAVTKTCPLSGQQRLPVTATSSRTVSNQGVDDVVGTAMQRHIGDLAARVIVGVERDPSCVIRAAGSSAWWRSDSGHRSEHAMPVAHDWFGIDADRVHTDAPEPVATSRASVPGFAFDASAGACCRARKPCHTNHEGLARPRPRGCSWWWARVRR
jgi:hypothetical protein